MGASSTMGRFSHDCGSGSSVLFNLVAGIALFVAWKALVIARDAQRFSERENIRAGNRERLRWMHEALNQLRHCKTRR
jgi:hypothetical protein